MLLHNCIKALDHDDAPSGEGFAAMMQWGGRGKPYSFNGVTANTEIWCLAWIIAAGQWEDYDYTKYMIEICDTFGGE